jgi:hypothetical protein
MSQKTPCRAPRCTRTTEVRSRYCRVHKARVTYRNTPEGEIVSPKK